MRMSDWSSDVCSSDLGAGLLLQAQAFSGQGMSGQHFGRAPMALGKKKQRPQVFVQLPARVGFGGVDVRQVLHYLRAGPLDECFKNGGFTVEMPIERNLGHLEPGRQSRRGDTDRQRVVEGKSGSVGV